MAGIEFAEVAARLPAIEFARAAGLPMVGRGDRVRARCPFGHDERRFNLAFLPDGKSFCYSCGKPFDTVQLAARVWGMSQLDAARELNQAFHLGIADGTPSADERRQRQQARRTLEDQRREAARSWAAACEAEQETISAMERFKPDDVGTPAHEKAWAAFCEAAKNIENREFEWMTTSNGGRVSR